MTRSPPARATTPGTAGEELVEPAERHADVELVRHPRGVDRIGMTLPQGPQARPAGGVVGDERVIDPRLLERGGELLGRV